MNKEEFGKVTLERVWTPYVVAPQFAYLQPKAEEIKQRDVQAECFLDFEVNKVNIRPEYMNNPQELAKIRKMIDELKSDPNVKVNRLDIIGYASPVRPSFHLQRQCSIGFSENRTCMPDNPGAPWHVLQTDVYSLPMFLPEKHNR